MEKNKRTNKLNEDKGFIPKPQKTFDKPKKEFDKSKKEFDKDKKKEKAKKFGKDNNTDKVNKFVKPREYDKEKEFDKPRGSDKDKKFDKPREFNKDKKFDKPREFNKDKKFDKPREFNKDKKFDKPRESDKDKKFDKPREADKDKKFDRSRGSDKSRDFGKSNKFDKNEKYSKDRKFDKPESVNKPEESDNQQVNVEMNQPVKKDKYILNKNKELIRDKNAIIKETIIDEALEFETAELLFSPTNIDKGTLAMLSVVELNEGDKLLDLGCGYGAVGIFAAKKIGAENVIMVDKSDLAVRFALRNAIRNKVEGIKTVQSDAYDAIDETEFTHILSNPPYHADFAVAKKFIEKGFNRLALEGKIYMVTKRKEWYKNRFIAIFGGVKIWEIDDYFVFMAVKKSMSYAPKKKKNNNKQ